MQPPGGRKRDHKEAFQGSSLNRLRTWSRFWLAGLDPPPGRGSRLGGHRDRASKDGGQRWVYSMCSLLFDAKLLILLCVKFIVT